MRLAVLALLACGCSEYARVALHNAPANVDLAAPPPGAHDDPGTEPGSRHISIWTIPYIIGGVGQHRAANASTETGIELRVERSNEDRLLDDDAWAVTAGMGIVQWNSTTVATGPIYAELDYRTMRAVIPIDVGVGPAFYPQSRDAGAQLTIRFAAIGMLRTRVMTSSGFEIFGGLEIPVPFFFGWSK